MTYPEPLGLFIQLACQWEVTARKPGNVHRFEDFDDVHYTHFLASSAALASVFDCIALNSQTGPGSVGNAIETAIVQTRRVTATNTNLGIVLLCVPLAFADQTNGLHPGLARVLVRLGVTDAQAVYRAIRLAAPGGLGEVTEQDVRDEPVKTLREVMTLASDRDLIALQYANGFREVFDEGVPALQHGLQNIGTLEDAIIYCHLRFMSHHPDSLIARKCGQDLAVQARQRAEQVLAAGWPHSAEGREAIADLDAWLRADGHRRNPGTSADLVAASLFVALREGIITLPPQVPWAAG
jgi:triphosphoribosyl-dephospho-CoA synthase